MQRSEIFARFNSLGLTINWHRTIDAINGALQINTVYVGAIALNSTSCGCCFTLLAIVAIQFLLKRKIQQSNSLILLSLHAEYAECHMYSLRCTQFEQADHFIKQLLMMAFSALILMHERLDEYMCVKLLLPYEILFSFVRTTKRFVSTTKKTLIIEFDVAVRAPPGKIIEIRMSYV